MIKATDGPPYPRHEVRRFSTAERDRRWAQVRALMERDGIDAIVALGNTGAWESLNANTRYLVGIGGNCSIASAIFPLDGEVTAVVGSVPGAAYWRSYQDWVTDIREPTGFFAVTDAAVARLRELSPSAQTGRIGIAGLADLPRVPEGAVAHGAYERMREALPQAELVNATALLEEARFIKSDEEIDCLRRGVEIVEGAIDVVQAEARPGVAECVVYARALAKMVEEGSEIPTFFSWQAGWPQQQRNHFQPTQRPLQAGDVISTEIDARVLGYRPQVTQPFVLGPVSSRYAEMMSIHAEALQRCYDAIRPGATPGELATIAADVSRGPYQCRVVIHGRGLGDDAPLLVFRSQRESRGERMSRWTFERNAVLMVKPYVFYGDPFEDFIEESVGWGDTVVVTDAGPRRLGTKRPEIIEVI